MTEYKTELKKILLLTQYESLETRLKSISDDIGEKDFAHFFIDSLYLRNIIQFLIEDHWIQTQNSSNDINFDRFIKKFLNAELKPLLFLHSFFLSSNIDGMRTAERALHQTEKILLSTIKLKSSFYQKLFLQIALQRMSELYEHEIEVNSTLLKKIDESKISLYRTFDILDEIFGLNYILDENSSPSPKERIYEGAGIGVQSSYSTTLTALKYLNLGRRARFIDLGSGYGRVGLVIGLMRPDVQFVGYEFVPERVKIANQACTQLLLDQHVQFITQDLSDADFKIPAADAYYIFDSFTDETYAKITAQLEGLTQTQKVTVVTKGNARLWMKKNFWTEPQEFNDGNICFFRSKGLKS